MQQLVITQRLKTDIHSYRHHLVKGIQPMLYATLAADWNLMYPQRRLFVKIPHGVTFHSVSVSEHISF